MGKPRLTGHTTVTHPDTNESVTFTPDDDVPDWAVALITNPSAWAVPSGEKNPETGEDVYISLHDRIMQLDRDELFRIAEEEFGLEPGSDFPRNTSKTKLKELLLEKAAEAAHEDGG